MAKANTKATEPKQAKTIKVTTLVISIAVVVGMIASFIGGIFVANNYQNAVKAQAVELSKELKPQGDK